MKKIAICGCGGCGRELIPVIKDINKIRPEYEIIGFVDNTIPVGTMVDGYPVIGDDATINQTKEPISLILGFGEPGLKEKVRHSYTNPLVSFPAIIHPSVWIADKETVKIGEGCIICAGCMLTTNIEVKDFVTLNLMCTVGHDTIIGAYSSCMASVNLAGEVRLGDKVYVGTGAKIINQVSVGKETVVGAGAVVVKSLRLGVRLSESRLSL